MTTGRINQVAALEKGSARPKPGESQVHKETAQKTKPCRNRSAPPAQKRAVARSGTKATSFAQKFNQHAPTSRRDKAEQAGAEALPTYQVPPAGAAVTPASPDRQQPPRGGAASPDRTGKVL